LVSSVNIAPCPRSLWGYNNAQEFIWVKNLYWEIDLKSTIKNSGKKLRYSNKYTLQSTLLYLYFTSVGNDGGYYRLYT